MHLLRAASGEIEAGAAKIIGRDILEGIRLRLPFEEFGNGRGDAFAVGEGELELNDAIRVRVGERLQQDRIHNREDGSVGPDAKRQGGDSGDREAGILGEHAQRMLEVIPKIAHE